MMKVNKKPSKQQQAAAMTRAVARVSQSIAPTAQTIDYIAESFGRHDFIRAMRLCSQDTQIMEILQLYDRLGDTEKNRVSLDALCMQVDLPPEKLCATVCNELVKVNGQTLKMILSTATPTVLRAGITNAGKPEGLEDRKMVYQMSGLMPFDKGNEVNINQNFGAMRGVPRFEEAADAEQSSILGEVVEGGE
jgi:hypothetical protein